MFWNKKIKSLKQEVEALKKEIMLLKHNVNLLSISCVVMQFDAETQCDALEHMDLDTEQVNLTLKMGHDYDQRLKKFILDTMAEDRRKRAKKKANGKENNADHSPILAECLMDRPYYTNKMRRACGLFKLKQ